MVQWLRLLTSTAGAWVPSLVKELSSCMPHDVIKAGRWGQRKNQGERNGEGVERKQWMETDLSQVPSTCVL